MSARRVTTFAVILVSSIVGNAFAQSIVPSALLTIDQNRATVVERIVGQWGDRLTSSNAGITAPQLREILSGLRSDHLLAASLAGSIEGLRDVVSGALVRTDASVSPTLMHTKSMGDTTDDLVYTPVVPCRIVDTRSGGGGVFLPGNQRNWLAFSPSGFASQGGSATNCGIPVHPAAIMANTTLANTVGGLEFFTLWPFNQARPTASTVNWFGPGQQPANAEIVPLCTGGACTFDFSAYASGQTQAIIDVLGYFNRPTNYGGTHMITGIDATDSGGFGNTASGGLSTVGGGDLNTASGSSSTVAGGNANTASGDSSTVAGGGGNIASGNVSTVAGGASNIASGAEGTVAGGQQNTASGQSSTVAGGQFNIASGDWSTVAGGYQNTASGNYSFAAGNRAKALGSGSFVWADSKPFDFINTVPNVFAVRATGGATFTTDIDGSGNPIGGVAILPGGVVDFGSNTRQMINLYGGATPSFGIGVQLGATYFRSNNAFCWHKNGVHNDIECDPGAGGTRLMRLDGGGNLFATTFTPTSDRDVKRDFAAVDSLEILDKVVALPISTWAYKIDPGTRHIGPMAQDFTAAFGMGVDDKHIATVDADGVALVAIQGLHQLIKQKDRRIAVMEGELAAIKAKLNMR